MARHVVEKHRNRSPPNVAVHIMHISNDPVRRRILEAVEINIHKPKINIKAEMTEVVRWL